MEKKAFVSFMEGIGWERDTYGHLKKTLKRSFRNLDGTRRVEERLYRVKLQDISCRIEVRGSDSSWIRVGGDYYSKIVQLPEGKIQVGSHFFVASTPA